MKLSSLLAALALGCVVMLWLALGPEAQSGAARSDADAAQVDPPEPDPVPVIALRSEARALPSTLVLRGVTEASRKVEAKAQTSGLVVSEPQRKGARVERGDLLCEIETGERESQLAEANARLAQAQADAEASRSLAQKGYSSETALAADLTALAAAEAAIKRIELDIARRQIHAPFDGVLETDAAEIGDLMQPGSVCASIVALNPIHVVGFASEAEVGAIRLDAPAEARVLGGETRAAEVSFVSRVADPDTRTFRVEATTENADEALRDGMTAELTIPLESARAHLAPHSALTLDEAGALGVRVVDGDRAAFQPVVILRDDAEGVWLAGLPDEAAIVVLGQEYVTDRSRVSVSFRSPAGD